MKRESALAVAAGASTPTEPAAKQLTCGEYLGLLTVAGILEKLPISRRTLCDHIKHGRIPAIKLGRRILFDWESVRAALLRQQRASE